MRTPPRTLALAAFAAVTLLAIAPPPSSALEIKRIKLDNGATLLVSEEHRLPMVTVEIAFDAGSRRDPKGKAGLAALTAQSLSQGTKTLSAAQFNRKIDFMGSSVSVGAGRDYAVAGFTSLKRYEDQTLHLLASILQDPGLRTADIERKRAQQVADIKSSLEQPGYVAGITFRKELFGDSPYGYPTEGTAESVDKLTPQDVRDFYHKHYRMGSAVIAVVGDVKADEIKAKLEKELSGMKGTVPPEAVPSTPEVPAGLHVKLVDRNVAQANLIMGFAGIARSNPDYYRIMVMNYILGGGGFASRLMKVVRSKHGLAYSIYSGFEADKFPGPFVVVLQTKNSSSNEALRLILQQLHEIQETPVSDAELQSAKKFLVGSFPLKLDRQSSIAGFMLDVQLNGLGLDYAERYPKLIDAVTKEEVKQVARKYLHPDAMLLVAVANQGKAKINVQNLQKVAAAR
jgi:zinc protease